MAWTIALALILMGTAGTFVYVYKTMDEKHEWLALAFVFFSLIVLMVATNVGINIVETQNQTYNISTISPLTNRLGGVYMVEMLALILTAVYFFIYIILRFIRLMIERKERKEHEI